MFCFLYQQALCKVPPECSKCVSICRPQWLSQGILSSLLSDARPRLWKLRSQELTSLASAFGCHPFLRKWRQNAPAACTKGDVARPKELQEKRKKKSLLLFQNTTSKTHIKLIQEMLSLVYKYDDIGQSAVGYAWVFLGAGMDLFHFVHGLSSPTWWPAHALARCPPGSWGQDKATQWNKCIHPH